MGLVAWLREKLFTSRIEQQIKKMDEKNEAISNDLKDIKQRAERLDELFQSMTREPENWKRRQMGRR